METQAIEKKKRGRPRKFNGPTVYYSVRLPISKINKIEEIAKKYGISKTEAFRLLILLGLEETKREIEEKKKLEGQKA